MGEAEIKEISRVIRSGNLFRIGSCLKEVDRFEREWASLVGTRYALCLSGGGTAGLICALVGLGIGPGDEVLVPGYTFMATALAVLAVGAIPVVVEIDETLTLDPEEIERKAGPNTRAVIPVHMVGRPANLSAIRTVCRKKKMKIIEDACQAVGGSYRGKRLGAWGEAGVFSFNYYKIISCGEGGAVVTDNRTVYERALVYHDGGASFRPYAGKLSVLPVAGLQLRASEIMGALLRVQRRRLDSILKALRQQKKRLEAGLKGYPGIRLAPCHDEAGDCGVVAAFQFDTEEQARRFASFPGVGGSLPIDSGKHVYTNWEPLLNQRAGPHPDLNPYFLPANQPLRRKLWPESCPRTLQILKKTVLVAINPYWTKRQLDAKIKACREAGKLV
ncbi:MAG TPA: DegT/DnrJ/EryC1/StrS family aminotransferase [bacterium]|nr:DegT/DnrJ/EryC1/StrS family aminotransferase [bacterium]